MLLTIFMFFVLVILLVLLLVRLVFAGIAQRIESNQKQYFDNKGANTNFGYNNFYQNNKETSGGNANNVRIYKNSEQPKKQSKKDLLKNFGDYTDYEEIK